MNVGKPDIGEQALSKAVEIGLSTQLDEVEELGVDIRTNPIKLIQGELESVEISGEGLVMQKDLRAEEMQVRIDDVAINPFKAAFGEIELTHSTSASVQVTLTGQDIERAFNSDYIKNQLQNLEISVDGQLTTVNTNYVEFCLPGEGKIALTAEIVPVSTGEAKRVSFTAMPRVSSGGEQILLEQIQYPENEQGSPELTAALVESASELLDLRNFSLEGMLLRIKQLDVQVGKMMLDSEAQIEHFPAS